MAEAQFRRHVDPAHLYRIHELSTYGLMTTQHLQVFLAEGIMTVFDERDAALIGVRPGLPFVVDSPKLILQRLLLARVVRIQRWFRRRRWGPTEQ